MIDLTWAFALQAVVLVTATDLFQLRLLHMNDLHSRFQQVTKHGSKCTQKALRNNECVGGVARIKYKVEQIRNSSSDDNVLFLMAGDLFQGTLWYSKFKWKVVWNLTSSIGLDAISLGNHEFDDGLDDLTSFVRRVPYAVVTDNVDVGPDWGGLQQRLLPYKVFSKTHNGVTRKVGVIGYVTPDTEKITTGGRNAKFTAEEVALAKNVQQLRDQGVEIIIAVGHSGYQRDLEIASRVNGLDVVIGGHTNTFLWPGETPAHFKWAKMGEYPTVVQGPAGGKTLVVQTNGYGRFLGDLTVGFDPESGALVNWEGRPIFLDSTIKRDQGLLKKVEWYSDQVAAFMSLPIGKAEVALYGGRPACRLRECQMGSFLADAMVNQTGAPIALVNSGSFKASLSKGDITMGDLFKIMPYSNELDVIRISGRTLRLMLEHSVHAYDAHHQDPDGYFLQLSGAQVVFDVTRASGDRVTSLRVAQTPGQPPAQYVQVRDGDEYEVACSAFIAGGGDGYEMLDTTSLLKHKNMGLLDKDILSAYIKEVTPVKCLPSLGRMIFVEADSTVTQSGSPPTFVLSHLQVWGPVTLTLILIAFQ